LIITLILLGVVTFMAVAFLALSRRERGAVTTVTDTASARYAADAALAGAEAQIVASVLSTTNPCNFGLLVSTNYINAAGFVSGVSSFTNVNYQYPNGTPVTGPDFLQLLANLYYRPRPPVFIPNPVNPSLPPDFRYYLDLNRNGRYDTNGWVDNFDNNNIDLGTSSFQIGDPEWIGVLQRPDQPYGPNNPFVARYAFIAVAAGNTLDLNAIHNDVKTTTTALINPDGYFRNQGVGSWEINLAAFLADLNTNEWLPTLPPDNTYYYYQYLPNENQGIAFDDARALLAYRYQNNYNSLASVDNLFGLTSLGHYAFLNDNIDGYSEGPLQTSFQIPGDITIPSLNDNPRLSWAGADNINHFFSMQELFNTNESSIVFTNRLQSAGTNNSTYDRYTFYRLLSQLGTDSTPESGRMNLNYSNALVLYDIYGVATNISIIPGAETNFVPWRPLDFFNVAADRLLRAYTTRWRDSNPTNFAITCYGATDFTFANPDNWNNYPAFGIGRIPVLVSNQFVYSSAVNRLLQLAANMYDATANSFYPSVFRPCFSRDFHGNLFITGYTNVDSVSGVADINLSPPFDASEVLRPTGSNIFVNVYGVPWIIGAKKGFPNFNKFTMQNVVQITRKLQIKREIIPVGGELPIFDSTNQLYVFSISNSIGMDCWNSYATNYPNPNPVQIVVYDNLSMMLTNDGGAPSVANSYPINANITLTPSWPGSAWNTALYDGGSPAPTSFIVPINTAVQFLTNSVFYSGSSPPGVVGFYPEGDNRGWESNKTDFSFPQFGLLTTNRLRVFMLDGNHVIDYVQFAGPDSSRNLNAEFQNNSSVTGFRGVWNTNLYEDLVPWGIINQIDVSRGMDAGYRNSYWAEERGEISGFADFMGYSDGSSIPDYYKTNYIVQVPYSPTVTASEYISWQANDPLVHYLAADLNFQGPEKGGPMTGTNVSSEIAPLPRPSFNIPNDRYQPWGTSRQMANAGGADPNPANPAFKDPLVRMSDNWDFPTSKLPTVGWLGRVHRGTPWQTVYLKATNILNEVATDDPSLGTNTWMAWTGNFNITNAAYNVPAQDRLLFDLFTTAFNDNATRGTLSVNVGPTTNANLAAWSALFSGSVVLSNNAADDSVISYKPQMQTPPPSNSWMTIQPAGVYDPTLPLAQQPPVVQIVQGINSTRAIFTNADGLVGTFEHVGDILSVPQFTEQSPFLNWNSAVQQQNGISDEMYEWLPQQTMSLLRCSSSPRYVIYCYGQALKPAPDSIVTSGGPFFGMITNYQVVSEIATRAVVRFNSTVTNVITTDGTNWFSLPVVTNNNAVIESFNILPPD
jgi:hypothetical protein